MRPTKNIEKSIRQLQDRTGADLDARTLSDACQALAKKQQTQLAPGKPNIWGIVMRNRTIRIATAAAVIIGVLLGIQHFTGSVDGTSTAFAQMAEAMKQMRWMHGVAELTWPEEDKYRNNGRSETWQSFELGIYISILPNGEISFFDHNKKEVRIYDPEKNQITISYKGTENEVVAGAGSPQEVVEKMVKILSDNEGATVDRRMEKRDGKEVEIIKVSVPRGEGLEEWINIVDPKTHLPLGLKLQGHMEDGKFVEVMDGKFDYPETGPADIYALGVPKTAEIIDKRPTEQVASIIGKYQNTRENAIPKYIAVAAESLHDKETASDYLYKFRVVYTDGILQRTEIFTLSLEMRDLHKNRSRDLYAEIGGTAESVIKWLSENIRAKRINLYDGESCYDYRHYQNVSPDTNRKSSFFKNKNGYRVDIPNYTLEHLEFFELGPDKPAINLIENEYSKSHDLICLEKISHDGRVYAEPHGGRRYRMLCYLDPQKDYLCIRFEMHFVKDKLWQEHCSSSASDIAPEVIEKHLKAIRTRQVTEFAQTADGKWYPKTITSHFEKELPEGGVSESNSTYNIYLNGNPQFAGGIFDPETLPKQPD